MKRVPLKVVDMGDAGKLDYREHIVMALQTPMGQGITYDEMSKVLPVIDNVNRATGDAVHLEDAEHALVVERIKKAQYRMAAKELFTMIKEIIEAPTAPVAVEVDDACAQ